MTIELDEDELALHNYQLEHFSEILPFVLRHMVRYRALTGALLSGIFYLWTYRDTIQERNFLTLHFNPPPEWPEVVLNCVVRMAIGALVGCVIAVALGFIYAKLVQKTCHQSVSTAYVEPFDLKLLFLLYQIVLPIPVIVLILIIETPVLWYADTERGIWFIAIGYVAVYFLLSAVTRRFLKWFIPPLLPPLHHNEH